MLKYFESTRILICCGFKASDRIGISSGRVETEKIFPVSVSFLASLFSSDLAFEPAVKLCRFKLFHRNRYRSRILGPTSGVDRSQNFVVRPKSRRKISGLFSGQCSVWFFRLSSGWKVSSQLRSFGFCFGSELGGESEKTENKKEDEKFLGVRYKLVFGSFRVFVKGEW